MHTSAGAFRIQRRIRVLGARGSWELSVGCWELNVDHLEEQEALNY